MSAKYCACCSRQLVNYRSSRKDIIGPGPVYNLGFGKYCCQECGKDLDDNGLFPEERDEAERIFVEK